MPEFNPFKGSFNSLITQILIICLIFEDAVKFKKEFLFSQKVKRFFGGESKIKRGKTDKSSSAGCARPAEMMKP